MSDVILVRNASFAIAWDVSAGGGRHVYDADVDIAFPPAGILHVGPGCTGSSAALEEAQRRALDQSLRFDWAGRAADQIAPRSLSWA